MFRWIDWKIELQIVDTKASVPKHAHELNNLLLVLKIKLFELK